jgi:hypothetical protein
MLQHEITYLNKKELNEERFLEVHGIDAFVVSQVSITMARKHVVLPYARTHLRKRHAHLRRRKRESCVLSVRVCFSYQRPHSPNFPGAGNM